MIIKGLFRRYQRWNPVHPTSGAFWGIGIGFGCGVGWGPGFGPEVIGYVGAGCGVGFSVGITLACFGIGLPAYYVFEVPYNGTLIIFEIYYFFYMFLYICDQHKWTSTSARVQSKVVQHLFFDLIRCVCVCVQL